MITHVQYLYISVSSLMEQGTKEREVPRSSFYRVGHMYFSSMICLLVWKYVLLSKYSVTVCGHIHNTLVQHTSWCTGRYIMQIKNPVVYDTGKR